MRATVICNPSAGQRSCQEDLMQAVQYLQSHGIEIASIDETLGPGDAETYARRAAQQGSEIVFLSGGDGTIAQTVDGLVGTETALAVLPGGTGNVFARQLNLPVPGGIHPRPLLESARLLLAGRVRPVDVGRVTARGNVQPHHFLSWGGIGFDAEVNQALEADRERKRRLGITATILTSFLTARYFAGTSARIMVDGHRVNRRVIMLVASNIQIYGVVFRLAQHAVIDDGWLDVVCFQGTTPRRTLLHAIRLFAGRHTLDPEVDIYRARRLEITTVRPLAVSVDADPIGYTPITVEVVPKALNLLVPSCAPASLFADRSGTATPETVWEWMQRIALDVHSALRERSGIA